jgi:hypothetical protein
MLTRLVFAGAIVLLIQGTAAAQYNNGGSNSGGGSGSDHLSVPIVPQDSPPTAEQSWRQKELDKAYEATTRTIPNKKASTDPWGDLRSTKSK